LQGSIAPQAFLSSSSAGLDDWVFQYALFWILFVLVFITSGVWMWRISHAHFHGAFCDKCKHMVYPRKKLAMHQADECVARLVSCHRCQQLVRFSKLTTHMMVACPQREVECLRCGLLVCAVTLERHNREVCPRRVVKCVVCGDWIAACERQTHARRHAVSSNTASLTLWPRRDSRGSAARSQWLLPSDQVRQKRAGDSVEAQEEQG